MRGQELACRLWPEPHVAQRFKIDRDQEIIFDHSFAGHFVLYALVNRPTLFDTFIAASPSIWFEDKLLRRENLRKRLETKLATTDSRPRVLVTVGDYEKAADLDFPPALMETLLALRQPDNARKYADWLAGLKGIEARFELLNGHPGGH